MSCQKVSFLLTIRGKTYTCIHELMQINIIYNLDSYKKENDTKTFMNSESSDSVEFFLLLLFFLLFL